MLDELHRQGRHVLFEPHSSIQSEVFTSQSLVVKTRNSFAQERNRSCSSPSVRVEEMIANIPTIPFISLHLSLLQKPPICISDSMQRLQKGNSKAKSVRKVLDVFSRIQRARVTLAVWRTSGELWCVRVRLSLECNFRMWSRDGPHISIESLYISMHFLRKHPLHHSPSF